METEEVELTEEEVGVPLAELVIDDKKRVRIDDMADYYEVFFAIECSTLLYWESHEEITDKDVMKAFNRLLLDFDNQKEGTLASEISKAVKANLILRRRDQEEDYTFGEIASCISFLKRIAKHHKSPDGRGYLKWIRAFFEGRMPMTEEEIVDYILQNEV
ncbi:MAG: hypothetical protein ACE5KV_05135 [Thermoplasmata archaeon]